MNLTETLPTAAAAALPLLLVAAVVLLLERTHRRAVRAAGGRLPALGRTVARDADARRLVADLRALPEREPAPRPRTAATASVPVLRGRRHVWVSRAR